MSVSQFPIAEKPESGSALPNLQASDQDATLITSGAVVRLRMPDPSPWNAVETVGKTPGGGSTRGIIRGRSKASRRRFQQGMGRIDLSAVPGVMLLTLTWSADAIPEHSFQQRCLDNFLKWIVARFKGAPVAWAKERGTQGGRWHFHLVVFGCDYVTCQKYQSAWDRIAGRFAGNVDVKFKRDAAVVRYLAKYISKEVGVWQDDGAAPAGSCARSARGDGVRAVDLGTTHISPKEQHTGRTWGWRHYKKLSLCPVTRRKIPVRVAHQVRRTFARLQKAELRRRVDQWREWETASNPNLDPETRGAVPGWLDGAARKEKQHPWAYCGDHLRGALREYARFLRKGSHLARGSYDRRGWSCFATGDGTALTEGLSTYFEGI
jgi:hypothetical protein